MYAVLVDAHEDARWVGLAVEGAYTEPPVRLRVPRLHGRAIDVASAIERDVQPREVVPG